ncbi:MAG: hypothetical protein ACI8ZM_004552 [Crocinitomix sp.]|jgi:hypothetical protein
MLGFLFAERRGLLSNPLFEDLKELQEVLREING